MPVSVDNLIVGLRGNLDLAIPLIDDVPEEGMARQFGELKNHAAWQIGHTVVSLAYAAKLCGADYAAPGGWWELFQPGSQPVDERGRYPSKAELLDHLRRVCGAIEASLPALDAAALAAPFPEEKFRSFWPTLADGLVFFAISHFAYHLGQLSSWRRVMNLPRALPS